MSMEFTSEKLRRVVMTVAGVTASGVAVGFFNYSAFGMDPFQVLAHGLWNLTPIGYGTFYTIFSLLLFVFTLVMDRKKIGLGTVINMFLLGYITEFFSWLFATLFPGGGFFFRLIMLLIGITIMCLAASLYFTANMGVSVYDAIALCLSERTPIKFQYCRIGSDVVCVVVGFIFGAQVGLGTVITMFFRTKQGYQNVNFVRRNMVIERLDGRCKAAAYWRRRDPVGRTKSLAHSLDILS